MVKSNPHYGADYFIELAHFIRTQIFGKDVRESLAKLAEYVGSEHDYTDQELEKGLQKFADLEAELNNLLKNVTDGDDLSEVIDARLSAKYGFFDTLKKRFDHMENLSVNIADNAMIGQDVHTDNVVKLNEIRNNLDQSKFNLTFITDVHYARISNAPKQLNNFTLNHLNNALYLDGAVDAIVFGGDNIDGGTLNKTEMLKEQEEFGRKALFSSGEKSDKFILKGNHDDASMTLKAYQNGNYDYLKWLSDNLGFTLTTPETITDDELKKYYQTQELLFDEHRQAGSLYFYKDYPDKKTRLIGLNSNDDPVITNEDGTPKYPGLQNMGYQEPQIDWLANTALQKVPSDYVVVIVGHIPPAATGSDEHNQELVNQIINAFQNGTAGTATSDAADWKVNVAYDFSQQGSRDVAAYLNGHLHQEYLTKNLGFDVVSVTSSINATSDNTGAADNPDTDGWQVLTVDPENRKIILTGFGRGTDREATY